MKNKDQNVSAITKNHPSHSLKELGELVRLLDSEIDADVVDISERSIKVVARAFDMGDYLVSAKEQCGHGQWEGWRDEYFSKGETTARKLMRLAEIPKEHRSALLTEAKSINDLYRLVGILPPVPVPEPKKLTPSDYPPIFQRIFLTAKHVVDDWDVILKTSPTQQAELKASIKPMVDLYQMLP